MLQIENLIKKFGSFTAVNSINLKINRGEIYGFLGPNGAGKTTTIKMIAGLYSPTEGTITIDGIDINKDPIGAKSIIGYIPDQPFLYDKLTGREFLYFSGGLYKLDKQFLHTKIDELITQLSIKDWIDKRTEEYSLGMRQRITFASAFLHSPKLILVDEPMVGLDPKSAVIVKNMLRDKAREGAAIFMSTHSLSVAEEICDKIAIIKEGQIIYDGKKAEIEKFKSELKVNFESFFLDLTK
jgi:ABC-2 type transport system ATP-binding protein